MCKKLKDYWENRLDVRGNVWGRKVYIVYNLFEVKYKEVQSTGSKSTSTDSILCRLSDDSTHVYWQWWYKFNSPLFYHLRIKHNLPRYEENTGTSLSPSMVKHWSMLDSRMGTFSISVTLRTDMYFTSWTHHISFTFLLLKPGFHYPSLRVTGFHYPSTRAVLTGARFH